MPYSKQISIIVPIYNVAPYLDKCLTSIMNQNLESYEVIMVNDASTDNGGAIAKKWARKDSSFKYVEHPNNKGLSAARNTGLDLANGEFVTFVDSDDYLEENTLHSCLTEIDKVDVVEYPIQRIYSTHTSEWRPAKDSVTFKDWMRNNGFMHCYAVNKVYRMRLWEDIRFPVGKNFEDIRTIPHVLQKANSIKSVQHGNYYYIDRKGSISNSMDVHNLEEYTTALVELLSLPINTRNHRLYIRALNAERTYQQHGGKLVLVPRRQVPWTFILEKGLNNRERIKFLFYKLTKNA